MPLPSGTVTFLLTDLEGSTRMWEHDPQAMRAAMVRHDEILEKTIAAHRGHVFSRMGDGMAAAFSTASDAVSAALAVKQALAEEDWRTAEPLRARIGLHTAEAVIVDDSGYTSLPINRCARLMAAAHGGQILISGATEALVLADLPEGLTLIDLGMHRLRDLGRPLRVYQLASAHHHEEFPPLRTLDSFPGNLPAQISSFIGRQAETSRVISALNASRLVTITGVGGVGKTRLAIQVAAELLPQFPDGAWLVELATVRDPAAVVEAVAAALHMTNRSTQSLEDSLIEALSQKQLLLVFDNCEHVLSPVARLVGRIERFCTGVVVLATSREGMAVEGEQMIALPPLESGEPGGDIERLVHTDAVKLFVERARHVKADFRLSPTNDRAVVEICQRLDGVPLAIELAAARVMVLSPPELLRRLDHRFQVLAGGRRGAVERHATLRAAIDWSYELLSPSEQRLLARMAVFTGGCSLEAVEEVCAGDPVKRDEVMDVVTSLVARSLVVAEDSFAGTRFRLLETIRQYSEERLSEWGETAHLVERHAQFYADLSARVAQHFYGPDQLVSARQMKLERDNLRAALANAIDTRNTALAVPLVTNLPNRTNTVSPIGELILIPASRVLKMPGAAEQPGYPRVLVAAAYDAHAGGDWDDVEDLCRRALEGGRNCPADNHGPRIEADVCAVQAMARLSAGAYADALALYIRAAELAGADGYPGLAAVYLAYGVSSAVLWGVGHDEAATHAERSVSLARRSGMPGAIMMGLNALALTLVDDDADRARELLRESIETGGAPGEEVSTGFVTACLVAGRLRDWRLALALSGRAMTLWRWSPALLQTAPCLALCARALVDEHPEVAAVLQGAAYATFQRMASAKAGKQRREQRQTGPNAHFIFSALREAADLASEAIGGDRLRQLRAEGAGMTMNEAVSYALANIDQKLLTGPIASIVR
ncbi:NB-ARC domain-containing protein [Mycobacterium sp. 3519A]|uniref:ATP-binding protein n=1 Tax=Mycobacterium sp. 3519A TaxID=2057184 RepID=UPI000C7AB89D|nr:adenylate/guanylate cyclase domain-containing protein [Mycobacterium sp. 3519A]